MYTVELLMIPFSANNQSRPEWIQTFEHKGRFCNHSAFDLVLYLLKMVLCPCQMTHQQIIRDRLLWHKNCLFAREEEDEDLI